MSKKETKKAPKHNMLTGEQKLDQLRKKTDKKEKLLLHKGQIINDSFYLRSKSTAKNIWRSIKDRNQ